ncbi:MAG TPA: hypothetical protein VNF29_05995 [Candidatus Binataceae bacterium]|nr:hypothetical protein [Candidatus Binataceae bacterium]
MKRCSVGSLAKAIILGGLALALAACGAAGTAAQNETKIGCKFNSIKVCQNVLTVPLSTSGGITTSNQSYIADNSSATTWIMAPVKAPGGSEVDVQCQVNYTKKQVIYAYPTVSGTVSDRDRQWLRNTGMCIGDIGTQPAPKPAAEE